MRILKTSSSEKPNCVYQNRYWMLSATCQCVLSSDHHTKLHDVLFFHKECGK